MHKRKTTNYDAKTNTISFYSWCKKTVGKYEVTNETQDVTCLNCLRVCLSDDKKQASKELAQAKRQCDKLTTKLILIKVKIMEVERRV